jgi:four helix bundle protein
MKIQKFEDLDVWQLSRKYVKDVYIQTGKGHFSKDYGLRDQIRKASVSIMANISEGYERKTKNEFIQFLFISKGSCGESRSHLYVAYDLRYLEESDFISLKDQAEKISRSIAGFIKYLKDSDFTLNRF